MGIVITSEEVGTLLAKLRTLPLDKWKEEKPFYESGKEPDYINILGEYKVRVRGECGSTFDHSISISTLENLEVISYEGDGRLGDFYRELAERLRTRADEERKNAREERRKREEPKKQKEREKFLAFLGVNPEGNSNTGDTSQ